MQPKTAKDKQRVLLSSNYGISTNVSAPDLPVLNVDKKKTQVP